jgi:hypothetical protein
MRVVFPAQWLHEIVFLSQPFVLRGGYKAMTRQIKQRIKRVQTLYVSLQAKPNDPLARQQLHFLVEHFGTLQQLQWPLQNKINTILYFINRYNALTDFPRHFDSIGAYKLKMSDYIDLLAALAAAINDLKYGDSMDVQIGQMLVQHCKHLDKRRREGEKRLCYVGEFKRLNGQLSTALVMRGNVQYAREAVRQRLEGLKRLAHYIQYFRQHVPQLARCCSSISLDVHKHREVLRSKLHRLKHLSNRRFEQVGFHDPDEFVSELFVKTGRTAKMIDTIRQQKDKADAKTADGCLARDALQYRHKEVEPKKRSPEASNDERGPLGGSRNDKKSA